MKRNRRAHNHARWCASLVGGTLEEPRQLYAALSCNGLQLGGLAGGWTELLVKLDTVVGVGRWIFDGEEGRLRRCGDGNPDPFTECRNHVCSLYFGGIARCIPWVLDEASTNSSRMYSATMSIWLQNRSAIRGSTIIAWSDATVS